MLRDQREENHEYLLDPRRFSISDNDKQATYDQFIKLRDTLVLTNKYYASSAWRSLIIGTKLDWNPTWTIEIWEPNMVRLDFQPWGALDPYITWQYVAAWWHSWVSCEIIKKWRYKIQHKEQFAWLENTSVTRIHSYVVQHKADWTTQSRAVFDWEWSTAWEFKRITSFWYVECDLDKWDWLELKMEDQWWNDIQSLAAYDSNWLMVEYIDLAYKI